MARPRSPRTIAGRPAAGTFRPTGLALGEITVSLDEFEALRLADLERLEHADAAARMSISRQTFGRVLGAGRRKVAEALVLGRVLNLEGADLPPGPRPRCPYCKTPCRATKGVMACAACAPTLVKLGPARRARG
jgi:predicted DNA-binding protein (UPF0251 family)